MIIIQIKQKSSKLKVSSINKIQKGKKKQTMNKMNEGLKIKK